MTSGVIFARFNTQKVQTIIFSIVKAPISQVKKISEQILSEIKFFYSQNTK